MPNKFVIFSFLNSWHVLFFINYNKIYVDDGEERRWDCNGVDGGDQLAHSLINVIHLSVNRRQTDLLIRSNCLVYITFVPHYN